MDAEWVEKSARPFDPPLSKKGLTQVPPVTKLLLLLLYYSRYRSYMRPLSLELSDTKVYEQAVYQPGARMRDGGRERERERERARARERGSLLF